jgi:hypothetical protein
MRPSGIVAADGAGSGVKYVKPAEQQRPCLRCRQQFMSHGPGNRLCGACRTRDVSPFEPG